MYADVLQWKIHEIPCPAIAPLPEMKICIDSSCGKLTDRSCPAIVVHRKIKHGIAASI